MSIDPSLQRCRYYSAGRCNKGSDCNFSHGSEDSLASDCWGESTSVVEAVNHLATHSRNEHQKLCRYWKAGKCKSGSDCKFSHGAEDSLASDCWGDSTGAVEAVNPPATGSWDERRKTCSYWKAGNRKNGSDCKFSRETEDSLALDCWGSSTSAVNPPNTESRGSPRKTCSYWQAGNCRNGSDCKFSHGTEGSVASDCWGVSTSTVEPVDLATESWDKRQKTCSYWKAGNCKNGSDCKFSHGTEDSLASDCWGTSTSADNPPATESRGEPRKTCSYWKAGNCRNGSNCKFSHGTEDSVASDCWGASTSTVEPVDLTTESWDKRRKTCSYWKAGNCKNGSDCKFSHGTEDSLALDCWGTSTSADNPPATESRGEPRKTCSYWKAGNCRNGSDCKFSHGPEDSVASDCWGASTSAVEVDNPPTIESWGERRKTCSYWKAGKCKNGSDCRFSHGPEDSLASDCWGASTSAVEVDSPPATESWDCWGASTSAVEVDNPPTTEIWECWGASTGAVEVDNPPATETWECWGASTGAVEVDNPPVTESRGERRKTCSYWKAGNCKNGSNCRFSHGTEDSLASDCWGASTSAVEAVNSPATESGGKRQKTCSYWKAGNCRNGSDCKFSHGTEDSVAWDYSGASTNAA
ncbi:hypothetical protein F5J12DRAFT_926142 [Pisolithus orientalis]|uniref:uncharacterized protein n=1 Tax=Pisolithus orientalis TaxID=936130 RepID=UPI0022252A82|nr:uncharacterized protein F5J12DRAFT_926142 [Pisolithus orientalis]KAI6015077.1 hypothetical protein F5J12DRAFT_926142 [Pisolithus orientalis]